MNHFPGFGREGFNRHAKAIRGGLQQHLTGSRTKLAHGVIAHAHGHAAAGKANLPADQQVVRSRGAVST